jgi:hypothetical protein
VEDMGGEWGFWGGRLDLVGMADLQILLKWNFTYDEYLTLYSVYVKKVYSLPIVVHVI